MRFIQNFLQDAIYLVPAILISLTVHEFCHSYAAQLLGDPTAKNAGRLTLSPLSHLDPVGTICLLFFRFGWAKPVPVNPLYFRNPKKGMALTAAAGPASNIVLALVSMFCFYACLYFGGYTAGAVLGYLFQFFYLMTMINIGLAVFNMLPIAPLDGSKIFAALLPQQMYFQLLQYERYIQPVLFLLLFTGILSTPLSWLQGKVFSLLQFIVLPIANLLFN